MDISPFIQDGWKGPELFHNILGNLMGVLAASSCPSGRWENSQNQRFGWRNQRSKCWILQQSMYVHIYIYIYMYCESISLQPPHESVGPPFAPTDVPPKTMFTLTLAPRLRIALEWEGGIVVLLPFGFGRGRPCCLFV